MRHILAVAACMLAAPAPALADCTSELDAIFKAQLSTPYRTEMTVQANGAPMKVTADVIYPGSFHIKSDAMETIMLDKKAWMRMGGEWQAMPAEAAAMMAEMIETGVSKGVAGVRDVQCLGSQSYEGGTYDAYAFSTSGEMMGVKSTASVTLYAADGLPAWLVVSGEAMGTKSVTVQKVTFDPSITISPPQ
ncbi:MAG: hypothetical protein JNM45_11435 [Rhizobiales bacterium]|nr:hypothetical protein [Hyphomicrobiales bacterium]